LYQSDIVFGEKLMEEKDLDQEISKEAIL